MSIIFHCESCKKKIKAPDEAGGKWGSCPFCKHRCYVPLPPAAEGEEELKLMPLDEEYKSQYSQMMRETYALTQNILREKDLPDEHGGSGTVGTGGGGSEKELLKDIVYYLRLMADGELARAEQLAASIAQCPDLAKDLLKKMVRTEKPEPELADIAPRVLQGLIKELASRL